MGFKKEDGRNGKDPWKVANIMATYNYGQFRLLDGNRDVGHFRKLVKSILEIGVLYQPILVNENFEIVEGQGRFYAMKKLEKPILYVMQNGIGIKECRYLNSCSTNWKLTDYVHSHAHGEEKKIDYLYFENLSKEYGEFGTKVIFSATSDKGVTGGGKTSADIKSGKLELSEQSYNKGREVLTYLRKFNPFCKSIQGRVECVQLALIYCYNNENVDNEYLFDKASKYYSTMPPIANTEQAVGELERIYNFNLRGNREEVFLTSDYRRYARRSRFKKKEKHNADDGR